MWIYLVCVPILGGGHGRQGDRPFWAILGIMGVGSFLTLTNLKCTMTASTLALRGGGLFLHGVAIEALLSGNVMPFFSEDGHRILLQSPS